MEIFYRMADGNDYDALAAFWNENSGWDVIDGNEWKRRFDSSPYGNSVVSIAIDSGSDKIIGQFVFIPVNAVVNGMEVKACRPYAPIIHESLQTTFGIASLLTGKHPILNLYKKATKELIRQGVSLIYMVPDPRWARIVKAFPFLMTHNFPLFSRVLPLDKNYELPDYISYKEISAADKEIDGLWQHARHVYTSAMIRDSKSLPFKTSHGDYKVIAINNKSEMIGLFALVYKKNDHQWLICDIVTKDANESLSDTLAAACNIIQVKNNMSSAGEERLNKIGVLATQPIEAIVKKMGFQQENYQFTMVVHILSKNGFDKSNVLPANWYVSAND